MYRGSADPQTYCTRKERLLILCQRLSISEFSKSFSLHIQTFSLKLDLQLIKMNATNLTLINNDILIEKSIHAHNYLCSAIEFVRSTRPPTVPREPSFHFLKQKLCSGGETYKIHQHINQNMIEGCQIIINQESYHPSQALLLCLNIYFMHEFSNVLLFHCGMTREWSTALGQIFSESRV